MNLRSGNGPVVLWSSKGDIFRVNRVQRIVEYSGLEFSSFPFCSFVFLFDRWELIAGRDLLEPLLWSRPSTKMIFFVSRVESSKREENCNPSCMSINNWRKNISICKYWVRFYWPDVGRFGLQVAPALVHVIQSVLEEHGFLWAAQSLDHLRLVAVHTLVDVIVGINLSLDVLQIHRYKKYCYKWPFLQGN